MNPELALATRLGLSVPFLGRSDEELENCCNQRRHKQQQEKQTGEQTTSEFKPILRQISNMLLISSLLIFTLVVPQASCLDAAEANKNSQSSSRSSEDRPDSRDVAPKGNWPGWPLQRLVRASIANQMNSNGHTLEAQALNQADREEEATGELSAPGYQVPSQTQVTDLPALATELHVGITNNDNTRNTLHGTSKLHIVHILAPEATRNGTQNVTIDCMFKFDKKLDQRLTVKWFFNDEVEPIYQWIPELNKRVYSDKYEQFLDKSYEVSEDVDFMLQAYRWLLAAGHSTTTMNKAAAHDTPSSALAIETTTSSSSSLAGQLDFGSESELDRAHIESSRKILANRLNKLARLGGQHSRQLLDSLRAALNMEQLEWSRYRALRLIKPTTELSGRFTCSVSSLDGDDLRSAKLLVYEPAKNFTFSVNRVSAQHFNLSCRAEQVFPRPTLTLYRYRAGPLDPQAQPLRQYERPQLAATLLRQEPIPGTQTQLTVSLMRQQGTGNSNVKAMPGELLEAPNDITPIEPTSANWPPIEVDTQNYQPMVYEISSWTLVDESTLSSKVVTHFECLLAIEGTGYEQRQSLALHRGWHVNSAGLAMRSTLVGLFSALASLLCLMLALVSSMLIFKLLKRHAKNRVHQAKHDQNNRIESNSGS